MPRKDFTAVRNKFARDNGLPFGRLLTREYVLQALADSGHSYRSRVFCPLVTLWAWLSQCLSQDKSLNEAVSRVLAHRIATGLPSISASSASYADARARFPECVMARMAREIGQRVHDSAPDTARWRGRSVFLVDGTGLSMPDTAENQLAYPQPKTIARGIGFPLMRASALISLATGAVVDVEFTRYAGKGTSELALLRTMMDTLKAGDVVVGDKLYGAYRVLADLVTRGVDAVVAIKHLRKRAGSKVIWHKPQWRQSEKAMYASLPDSITLRQITVEIEDRDGATKQLSLVTTITDPAVSDSEIADLYRQRWNCEVDLRTIKCAMQMDILRAKTPSMVHKEIFCHLLAYNLLRGVMMESASKAEVAPRHLSVKGALQMVESFTPAMMHGNGHESTYNAFLGALSAHRVGNRPGRVEPRVRKRRPKKHVNMRKPRNKYFRRLRQEVA
jgi:hypothetical protein